MTILKSNIEEMKPASYFKLSGQIIAVEAFGTGHINDTFCVTTSNPPAQYLLQRINHHIFSNVEGLMQNIQLLEEHLKSKLSEKEQQQADQYVLSIIPTQDNQLYYKDEWGNYWRMFVLITGTQSYDIVETEQQAREGGKAFGQFQLKLADLDAQKIVEVLPNFHNLNFRLSNFNQAIEKDVQGRVSELQEYIAFVRNREERMCTILKLSAAGKLPLRITHNDTKFNNVLLNSHNEVQCVIDLDTVMPGYVAYDFGDAIRTIINPAAEDEQDESKVKLNIPLFKAYAEGYLKQTKAFLTETEFSSLLEGVFLLPFMQGVRFLTDYLEGDHYYKVSYKDHNLVRTRIQFRLVQELEKHEKELQQILQEVYLNV